MIKSITVTNHLGDSLTMDLMRPEKSGFIVTNVEGLEPPKADINMAEVSTNDGGVFNSARATTRNVVLYLDFYDGNPSESVEDIRHKSYKYFPTKQKVKLVIETDRRVSEVEGYVESNKPIIFDRKTGTQISILCPYPYVYAHDEVTTTVFSGITPAFEFPFSNESTTENLLEMGIIENAAEQVIYYTGDSQIGMTISMFALGEATHITIHNVRTREQMKIDTDRLAEMTGSGITAGDLITISTVKGDKWVKLLRNGIEYNILNCLSRDADWFALSKGDNIFAYTAESGSSMLQFKIENRIVYEGV